jgi:hypothetical protein
MMKKTDKGKPLKPTDDAMPAEDEEKKDDEIPKEDEPVD